MKFMKWMDNCEFKAHFYSLKETFIVHYNYVYSITLWTYYVAYQTPFPFTSYLSNDAPVSLSEKHLSLISQFSAFTINRG